MIEFESPMLLADASAAVVTPSVPAIAESVSPALTVYVPEADVLAEEDVPDDDDVPVDEEPDEEEALLLLAAGVDTELLLPELLAADVPEDPDDVGVEEPGGRVATPETAEPVAVALAPLSAVPVPIAVPVPRGVPMGVKVAGVVGKTADVGKGSGGAPGPEQAASAAINATNGTKMIRFN
jgi:hypothetical protein